MQFIVQQLMPKKEKQKMSKIFNVLDRIYDGSLSREGMLQGYAKAFGNESNKLTEEIVDEIFKQAPTFKNNETGN